MRFPKILDQAEIDQNLARAKPRVSQSSDLPWISALLGLCMVLCIQYVL